ncbi:hypothetical protein AHF37_00253 [Paragonimus kellicotti]|nr:hypothetical protein AHF37_00253 [Paragonimus kellicotti]
MGIGAELEKEEVSSQLHLPPTQCRRTRKPVEAENRSNCLVGCQTATQLPVWIVVYDHNRSASVALICHSEQVVIQQWSISLTVYNCETMHLPVKEIPLVDFLPQRARFVLAEQCNFSGQTAAVP